MAYTVTDVAELIHYHLVLSEDDDARADANLRQLVGLIEGLASEPLTVEAGWIACESCGAWVGTELIGPDGAGYGDDDGFYCSECRWAEEDVDE